MRGKSITANDFEILYGRTRENLQKQLRAKIADGWEPIGERQVLKPDATGFGPEFVYFAQIIAREKS